ncbi:MAG: hypothetical protein ACI35P_10795 [Bacillus sp. (in: firmicutes)]
MMKRYSVKEMYECLDIVSDALGDECELSMDELVRALDTLRDDVTKQKHYTLMAVNLIDVSQALDEIKRLGDEKK